MGKLRTFTRRSFLIGSAAITGGVAFGVYKSNQDFENPNLANLPDGSASFNPWVIVDADKITLIAPHADKGQGVFSAQAALIAEELDVELDQVEISFGTPDKAYYNASLSAAAAPYPQYDISPGAERVRAIAAGAIKLALPMMGTGGSTAMADSFDKLRVAGAVARETLKLAASQHSGVAVDDLKTHAGAVVLPGGTRLAYTDLAQTAAGIRPVHNVTLRDPSAWRLIGKPMGRVDIPAKSTGTLPYGIDHQMDGMLHATIKVNPRQGGALNGFDATAARAMRGAPIKINGICRLKRPPCVIGHHGHAACDFKYILHPAHGPCSGGIKPV